MEENTWPSRMEVEKFCEAVRPKFRVSGTRLNARERFASSLVDVVVDDSPQVAFAVVLRQKMRINGSACEAVGKQLEPTDLCDLIERVSFRGGHRIGAIRVSGNQRRMKKKDESAGRNSSGERVPAQRIERSRIGFLRD